MKKAFLPLLVFIISCVIIYGFLKNEDGEIEIQKEELVLPETLNEASKFKKAKIEAKPLKKIISKIKSGQNLSEILGAHGVSYPDIHRLVEKSKKVYSPRNIAAGKEYTLIFDHQDSLAQFVYHKSRIDYIVYNLKDSMYIVKKSHKVDTIQRTKEANIQNSLSADLGNSALVQKLSEIYAWQIDFFHVQKNDEIKVLYEEYFVKNESVGIGKILASQFNHRGEDFYAFYYPQKNATNYFDEKGNSLKKAFLKAPLNFTRISSRFTRRRYHPVQKRYKAHLGTDYAAPRGTPIRAVGDGVVIASTYNRFNGNYVKIKHNSIYTTQYLHMSKRKKGLSVGKRVRQGDVIGYVGSTGLASGPHLCFRFWKHGKQVDALRVKLPPSSPIKSSSRAAFNLVKSDLIRKLSDLGKVPTNNFVTTKKRADVQEDTFFLMEPQFGL